MNIAFWKTVSVSTICRTGWLLNHINSIANSLLNTMFSFGVDSLQRKGGIEYSEHLSHFTEMSLINFRIFYMFCLKILFIAGYIILQLSVNNVFT